MPSVTPEPVRQLVTDVDRADVLAVLDEPEVGRSYPTVRELGSPGPRPNESDVIVEVTFRMLSLVNEGVFVRREFLGGLEITLAKLNRR
jgi:hypothetical protein